MAADSPRSTDGAVARDVALWAVGWLVLAYAGAGWPGVAITVALWLVALVGWGVLLVIREVRS